MAPTLPRPIRKPQHIVSPHLSPHGGLPRTDQPCQKSRHRHQHPGPPPSPDKCTYVVSPFSPALHRGVIPFSEQVLVTSAEGQGLIGYVELQAAILPGRQKLLTQG